MSPRAPGWRSTRSTASSQSNTFTPKWSDKPLLKSYQKVKPPLGWPRETDSLCPVCVRETRQEIVDGKRDYKILLNEKIGEIKATIIERDGKILMVKDCPLHGHFEDVMSIDPAFFKHLEDVFPGRDIRAHNDEKLHNHGSSTIKYGRGSVLTVDLTNRCNMMCDPCFMDANQVGFVHELSLGRHPDAARQRHLDQAARQMSVQFSGGEPTLSPYFLDAVRYSRKVGYNSVQAATNGIEFAKSPEFAKAAAEAGLRYAYLQFDGIGNAANSHRLVGNLFDVKLRAIENLHAPASISFRSRRSSTASTTSRSGRIVQFALDNPKKINFLSFQPVSFTGRDELITDERRAAQRYTLSHLAHDVKDQTGIGEPVRDWFPISFMSTFTDWADLVHGPTAEWGQLTCGCHPNCGIGMAVMIDKETKEAVPGDGIPRRGRARDRPQAGQRRRARPVPVGDRHGAGADEELRPLQGPDAFQARGPDEEVRQDVRRDRHGITARSPATAPCADIEKRRADRWNFLFIAGMWFQDLFNYDFRRTERCIIPYATQEGEISFCAYNTGVGWRNIIEKMHMTATLTKWYDEHGRHDIVAGGKNVDLPTTAHNLVLDPVAVAAGKQTDLDEKGIAKTAREEKLRARAEAKKNDVENERMAALYRQHVLKEAPAEPTLQIKGLGSKKKDPVQEVLHKPQQ